MPERTTQRRQQGQQPRSDYKRFADYLHIMHQKALELRDNLSEAERSRLEHLIGEEREHYWTAKKLFCHAMYIPMFLQIGMRYFKSLVYVDTHAGPGLARIGPGANEVILGSPLIALYWPRVVANNLPQYRKIRAGFTRLYFVEADSDKAGILREFSMVLHEERVKGLLHPPSEPIVEHGNANGVLRRVLRELEADNGHTLLYVFVDPLGSLESQLRFDTLELLRGLRVDLMLNVMTSSIARALSPLKRRDPGEYQRRVETLFGDLCNEWSGGVCDESKEKVEYQDILEAYKLTLKRLGFERVEVIPVEFRGTQTLYHVLLASKKKGDWINGYIEYITRRAPSSYEAVKRAWMIATGRQKTLLDSLRQPRNTKRG